MVVVTAAFSSSSSFLLLLAVLFRLFLCCLWAGRIQVDYSKPLRMADEEMAKKRHRKNAKVIYRRASPFGSAVSKSFKCDNCGQISSIMVHIPKFQIVQVCVCMSWLCFGTRAKDWDS